jgi:hypothetical protein
VAEVAEFLFWGAFPVRRTLPQHLPAKTKPTMTTFENAPFSAFCFSTNFKRINAASSTCTNP